MCNMCGKEEETSLHLFTNCPFIRSVAFASRWCLRWDVCSLEDLGRWVLKDSGQTLNNNFGQEKATTIVGSLLFVVWEMRNIMLFEGAVTVPLAVKRFENLTEFVGNNLAFRGERDAITKEDPWMAP